VAKIRNTCLQSSSETNDHPLKSRSLHDRADWASLGQVAPPTDAQI
jgi:hypothetical protein